MFYYNLYMICYLLYVVTDISIKRCVFFYYKLLLSLIFFFYYYFTLCVFFTSALSDGILQESKWQQVSSGLHVSFQNYDQSQTCCSLNSLYSSSDFQLFQAFGDCSKPLGTVPSAPNTTGITVTHMYLNFLVL